jgi:hypothetical protein
MLAVIDWDALPAAYGLVILGTTRGLELGRQGRASEAAVYGLIGALGAATVVAAIVFGIVVLSAK